MIQVRDRINIWKGGEELTVQTHYCKGLFQTTCKWTKLTDFTSLWMMQLNLVTSRSYQNIQKHKRNAVIGKIYINRLLSIYSWHFNKVDGLTKTLAATVLNVVQSWIYRDYAIYFCYNIVIISMLIGQSVIGVADDSFLESFIHSSAWNLLNNSALIMCKEEWHNVCYLTDCGEDLSAASFILIIWRAISIS